MTVRCYSVDWLHRVALYIQKRPGPAGERETGVAASWEVETGAVGTWQTGEGEGGQEEARTAQVRSQLR